MRINAFLSRCGLGSRRDVESLVLEGRVKIQGETIKNLASRVEQGQEVEVDGKKVYPEKNLRVLMLNKPPGFLCSSRDPYERPLVYELLPSNEKGLHSIGRLDFESRGLLFFTNEGQLSRGLLHPSRALPRVYWVSTNKTLTQEDLALMRKGILLPEGQFARPQSVLPGKNHVEIILTEGKKREVRHLVEATGKRVVDLYRTSFAGIRLGRLPEGEFRHLSPKEIQILVKAAGLQDIPTNINGPDISSSR